MLKVQPYRVGDQLGWQVIGEDGSPIMPIQVFLEFLVCRGLSPNTIRSCAFHLKLFWTFLQNLKLCWEEITEEQLILFLNWLHVPEHDLSVLRPQRSVRTASSVYAILSTVARFYKFHQVKTGGSLDSNYHTLRSNHYFNDPVQNTIARMQGRLRLSKGRKALICLSSEEIQSLLDNCILIRDKLFISLLARTSLKVKDLLNLKRDEVDLSEHRILICCRRDGVKTGRHSLEGQQIVSLTPDIVQMFSDYFNREYPSSAVSNHVFVDLRKGTPMTFKTSTNLFRKLNQATRLNASPRVLRLSFIRAVVDADIPLEQIRELLRTHNIRLSELILRVLFESGL